MPNRSRAIDNTAWNQHVRECTVVSILFAGLRTGAIQARIDFWRGTGRRFSGRDANVQLAAIDNAARVISSRK
jgi:hypothetical protein